MTRWIHNSLRSITLTLVLALSGMAADTPPAEMDHSSMHDHGASQGGHASISQWEGSARGKAYSEFNHHVAGALVVLIGFAELAGALGWNRMRWTPYLLPAAMVTGGLFLLIWSDHDAWPIGRLSFAQTILGGDHEIIQHKIYATLLISLGLLEWRRRSGHLRNWAWRIPLPMLAVVGGLMLFVHSHGNHPAAHKIALHHAAMGTLSLLAGSCKLISVRGTAQTAEGRMPRWDLAWSLIVLLIGVQLLFYSE